MTLAQLEHACHCWLHKRKETSTSAAKVSKLYKSSSWILELKTWGQLFRRGLRPNNLTLLTWNGPSPNMPRVWDLSLSIAPYRCAITFYQDLSIIIRSTLHFLDAKSHSFFKYHSLQLSLKHIRVVVGTPNQNLLHRFPSLLTVTNHLSISALNHCSKV